MKCTALAFALLAAPAAWALNDVAAPEGALFFEQEVQPLLAAHCFKCHGPDVDAAKGKLRLSGAASVRGGGNRGPAVVPGDPEASLLVAAVRYTHPDLKMPPDGKLAPDQIARLERWVAMGAPWPGQEEVAPSEGRGIDVAAGREWWSFRPLQRPPVPATNRPARTPIDAFVMQRLDTAGLTPSPPATDRELVRRAYFDLIGLPPTYAEVERYVSDRAPDKWERLIDRLLAMPEYGERWGRRWLDVVRFAQTDGYERDHEKPLAWQYRDYVIRAFNADKPFDRFLIEHLAGDELEDATRESWVATGFYHLGPWDEEPDDREQANFDGYDDVLRTVSEGFMGVTLGCARCHDHKYDPLRQRDYYEMLAFIRNVEPYEIPRYTFGSSVLQTINPSPEQIEQYQQQKAARLRELEERERAIADEASKRLQAAITDQSPTVKVAHATPLSKRTPEQQKRLDHAAAAFRTRDETAQIRDLQFERSGVSGSFPGQLEWTLAVRESREPQPTYLLARGSVDSPLEQTFPRFPAVLCASDAEAVPPPVTTARGQRLQLARWITRPDHRTTARVFVNRIWQGHFGRGIVPTPNDFGRTGSPPTHPALLDWLASEFVAGGYRIKDMHRLVMRSDTYRMASHATDPVALAADPGNDLFWRQNLRRLEAEAIRDAALAVAGSLNPARGGNGFFPELSSEAMAGMSKPGEGWMISSDEEQRRRSIYAYVKRGMMVPLLEVLDFANPDQPCGARAVTTIANQALALSNSSFMSRRAHELARRIAAEVGTDPLAQVQRGFELALSRRPDADEQRIAIDTLAAQTAAFATVKPLLRFRPKAPQRLEQGFLAQLTGADLIDAPETWTRVRGVFGNGYNDTLAADPTTGPATFKDGVRFWDGEVQCRIRFVEGATLAALIVRAVRIEDDYAGSQVVLDREAQEARIEVIDTPRTEARIVARAAIAVDPVRWYELRLQAMGSRLTAWIDGASILEAEVPAGVPGEGELGVRVLGDAVSIDALTITGEQRIEIAPPLADTPAERALDSLCLLLLNLNEFVYVD